MRTLRQVALVFGSIIVSGSVALAQGKLGPHVVDSNGLRIGYFAGSNYSTGVGWAVVFLGGEGYLIDTARNGFITSDITFYTANADCSGQQYLRVYPDFFLVQRAWFTTDGFFHYASGAGAAPVNTNGSQVLHGDGSLGPCTPVASDFTGNPLVNLPAPFYAPPFLVVDAFPVSPAPATATFNDVPTTHPFFQFIEALHAAGITGGCSVSPPLYCPDNSVTRGQMAVFLAKALGL